MNADAPTAERVPPDAPLVTLTERAIAKVHSALEGGASVGVRLTVGREKGSFTYKFDAVAPNQIDPGDPVLPCGQWRFYVDHASANLIRGSEIDYVSSGFTQGWVIDNPNPECCPNLSPFGRSE